MTGGKWRPRQPRQVVTFGQARQAPAPAAAAAPGAGACDGRFDARAYDFAELDRAGAYRDAARVLFRLARALDRRHAGFQADQARYALHCARAILQNLREYRKLYQTKGLP